MVNSKEEEEDEEVKEWVGEEGRVWDLVVLRLLRPIMVAGLPTLSDHVM